MLLFLKPKTLLQLHQLFHMEQFIDILLRLFLLQGIMEHLALEVNYKMQTMETEFIEFMQKNMTIQMQTQRPEQKYTI